MTVILAAACAAVGVFYLYTAVAYRWRGLQLTPAPVTEQREPRLQVWLTQAGLPDLRWREFAGVMAALALAAGMGAYAMFGGVLPPVIAGLFAAAAPIASYRNRRITRRLTAQEAWPRLLEEIRLLTGSVGRSIPQALFDVGSRAPADMQDVFRTAQREWLISTDFGRTVGVLKAGLADPTADAACETLLVAQELGGTDLDARLRSLIEDRIQDTQGRKDARSQQAGARFARKFVLIVPAGMAFAGLSVGNGRAAYQTAMGQLLVAVALLMVVACWVWAGVIMRLPEEERVFSQ